MSVAVTTSLPSPLQLLTVVVRPVSMTLMLGLITLALFMAAGQAEELPAEWITPPALDTFSTYEDMQRYFDHRNQRKLRHIENPSGDSYIAAFNFHNEQETHRTKRSAAEQKELPYKPKFIKFEMSDAVEPSDEVKELIRQYKSRTFQQNDKYLESVPSADDKKPIVKRAPSKNNNNLQKLKNPSSPAKRSTRPKRSTYHKQPAHFKVQYIPFDIADAREPDAQTKVLIKRMRALEIEKLARDLPNPYPGLTAAVDTQISTTSTTPKPSTKRPKYMKLKKPKRSRRSTPEMIKFELADARDSDAPSKPVVTTKKHTREAKDLKVDQKPEVDQQSTQAKANDQSAQASKRYFTYKEAPAKVKKSVSALPHDVQNILSHLIKGNNAGKANVRYLPGKQMDYRAYQAPKYGQAIYGHGGGGGGLGGYAKYAAGPVQAQKVQYVYHPVIVGGGGGGGGGGGHEGGGGAGIKYLAAEGGGGGGHEGGGEVKYVVAGGGGGGHEGGGEVKYVVAGGGGGHEGGGGAGIKYIAAGAVGGGHEGGGGAEVKYIAAGGGGSHEVGGDGGYGLKYVAAVGGGEGGHGGGYAAGGEGGHGGGYAAGGEVGHGGGYGGGHEGGGAGHVVQYVSVGGGEHGGGYAAEGGAGGHGEGYAAGVGHGGGYALVHGGGAGAHVNYGGYGGHAGGYEAAHGQAAAAIAHPIVVPDAGAGQIKGGGYEAGYGEAELAKNEGSQVIKNVPAPQFKASQEDSYETKYSVVPTVEQYANTPTQEFKLKLYSPESILAKAQLEAKDRAKAIEEQVLKAKAEAYAHAAGGGGGEGYGGGHGGGYAAGHGGGYAAGGHGGGYAGGHGGGYAAGHGGGYAAGGHGGGYAGGGGGEVGKGEGTGPLIKIEYHAPADSLKENYKDIAEFKQLSSLVGKSPEDQIHGLTYLLAKEMQNRLHLQRQPNYGGGGHGGHGGGGGGYVAEVAEGGEERPQDNKAPIQFHPDNGGQQLAAAGHYQALSAGPGKYIGLSKSQQYVPVIEQASVVELKAGGGGKGGGGEGAKAAAGLGGEGAGGKIAAPHSYIAYGLSPNYKGVAALKGGGALGHGLGVGSYNGLHDAGYDEAAAKLQSYASKYAFGYRIRDFNTGNDFGHKQNRDVHGVTRGQYHILLPDGRIQNVIYHADDTGFHADVSFAGGQ